MQKFTHLIFDIGDVIVDIDYQTTIGEFQKLSKVDFSHIVSYSKQNKIFDLFETGKISVAQFFSELRVFLKPDVTDQLILDAWNSILINYPAEKIDLLKQLKLNYTVFALSNINEIHVSAIDQVAQEKFGAERFADFFHHAYYSNEVGYRKPDKEIFEWVLNKENIDPASTFFVDDKEENVRAAKNVGIQAYQLRDRNKLHELLAELKIV